MKTNFLPSFPTKLFGSAKRKSQDTIRLEAERLMQCDFGGFTHQFASVVPSLKLVSISSDQRERVFTQLVTFWAWMYQIFNYNASCSAAVSKVQTWRVGARLPQICSSTSAYTQARMRLPMEYIQKVAQHLADTMRRRVRQSLLWKGLEVYSVDGSSVQLMDTLKNQKKYPQSVCQKKHCGFPIMKFLAILNHTTGAWEHHVTAHPDEHDAKTMQKVINYFRAGSLLLADRAFCSYEIIHRLMRNQVESVMRLHEMRAKGFNLKKGKRIGRNQRLVTWVKPRKPKASDLTKEQWKELDDEITMRIIVCYYKERNGEMKKVFLATTLLDAEKYGWIDLVNLYATRWDIELRLRDVKTTMQMEMLNVKSPEMAEKALAMALLGFNLVKAVSQEAALREGVEQGLLSFKNTLDWINSSSQLFKDGAKKSKKALTELYDIFMATAATKLMKIRPYRWEPRCTKRRKKAYPYMTRPRGERRDVRDQRTLANLGLPALT